MSNADDQLPLFDATEMDDPTARRSDDACPHPARRIHTLDCGPGGIQYREYCLTCWCDLRGAIKHAVALAELAGEPAPLIDDIEVVREAREAWWHKKWNKP
ncbi:hypothetical protein [Burkholderia pseudomallei]|uniref:hypothetical protein n=1 Tax=Burkholderia pseudomallei TaxID=28450 RepID=UPI00050FAF4E|nr:hypothetical protein [Burkholderia pseudomallei]KGC58840.1 hypothetical protein DP56_1337 [Burkholderia pseudomallei]